MRPAHHTLHILLVVASLASIGSPTAGASPAVSATTGAALGSVGRAPVGIFGEEPLPSPSPPEGVSEFALFAPLVEDGLIAQRGMTRPKKTPKAEPPAGADSVEGKAPAEEKPAKAAMRPARARRMGGLPGALSGERARLMLQSLTVPGWGQASLGKRRTAIAFGLLELGTWGSFTAFRIQQHMRQKTYESTARLFGGIELGGRDEEYRRIVGLYASSDEYNRLVVRRDAASLYYGDPAAYDAYVAAHEIRGADTWAWNSEDDFLRYRLERQAAQRASKHVQDALAVAVINRLLSVIHVSRSHPRPAPDQTSWRVECAPAGGDPTALRLALRADF